MVPTAFRKTCSTRRAATRPVECARASTAAMYRRSGTALSFVARTNQTVCVCGNRCWLSTENHFIWSFIGPACLIILVRLERRPPLTPLPDTPLHFDVYFVSVYFSPQVNLLAFGVIIYKVYRHTAVKKPEISHYENIR